MLACLFLPELVLGQFYPAKTYSTTDGMPSNSVYSITQADNKIMWFITSKGVVTFDANEWYLFPSSLDLPFTEHSYIQKDDSGRIWVAGYSREGFTVQYYNEDKWSKVAIPDSWVKERVPFSFRTVKNSVFLGFKNQLFKLNEDYSKWSVKEINSNGKKALINNLVGIEGELFIATNEGVFISRNNEIIYSEINELGLKSKNILSINKHRNSFYLLGFNWIGKIIDQDFELISDELGIFSESTYKKYSLEIDNRGRIYYSSFSMASVLNEETGRWFPLKVLGRQQNVLSNQVFVDAENNYWVGDNRGLFKFNLLRFKNLNSNTDLVEDEVSSIYETKDGRIILANPRGINFYDNGKISSIDLRNSYPNFVTRILDLIQTEDDRVFVALSEGGLISIKNGQINEYDFSVLKNAVTSLSLYKGELLVANLNTVYRLKGQKLELFGNFRGIRNIEILSSGKVAVLTDNGVYVTDGENTQEYSSPEKSLNNTYDIQKWNDNYLVATEAGLGVLVKDEIIRYNSINLEGNSAYSLLNDKNENLWIGTNDGVFTTNGEKVIHYNKKNGLIGNEINRNALIEDSSGDIWIGTDAGASVFDQREDSATDYIPNIELKEFKTLQGTELGKADEKSISYSENSVELKFRTISFFNEDEMSFEYKLEGFETEWNTSSNISMSPIRYTNLNPGNYTLWVKGRVESGTWSEPYSLHFIVQKPFYQKLWFILLSILLFIAIIYTIYRLRVLFLIKQRETLRRLVNRRTEEIDMQNRNLMEAYKELEEAHTQLVQTEKMAALGVLTAGIAHEINNPLNYIKSGKEVVKNLTEEDGTEVVIKDRITFYKVLEGIDLGVSKILNITKSLGAFTTTSDRLDSSVYLNKVIDDTLTILDHDLKDRINVVKSYQDKEVCVVGNEGKLYQIFSNLLTNSIHAIEGRGEITISIQENKEEIFISLADTGSGIPDKIMSKIFDPFFTTKEQGKGTGLGLSIVYNLIKELSGDIEVDSTVGNGTTITLKLKKGILES